jgi:hypothetical protein
MSGFFAIVTGPAYRRGAARFTNMAGQTVVCDEQATMAFYTFGGDLAPRMVAVETVPHGAAGGIAATPA